MLLFLLQAGPWKSPGELSVGQESRVNDGSSAKVVLLVRTHLAKQSENGDGHI